MLCSMPGYLCGLARSGLLDASLESEPPWTIKDISPKRPVDEAGMVMVIAYHSTRTVTRLVGMDDSKDDLTVSR